VEITCGKDTFDIKEIASAYTYKVSYAELKKLEIIYNGPISGAEERCRNIDKIDNDNELSIAIRKVKAYLGSKNFEAYVNYDFFSKSIGDGYYYIENIGSFDTSGDVSIRLRGEHTPTIYSTYTTKHKISLLNDVIPHIINSNGYTEYYDSKSKSYKKRDLKIDASERSLIINYHNLLKKREQRIAADLDRLAKRDDFLLKYEGKSILNICFNHDTKKDKKYLEERCGFDIFEKEREINQAIQIYKNEHKKQMNTDNSGEKAVEYALKWCKVTINEANLVSITNDCTSKYRDNCILLCKPSFIDEPQEYDHILVCTAGVVLLETKHWNGTIIIRPDGKWTRIPEEGAAVIGIDSPKFQIRRHAVLMKEILPDVPIYNILCFSNSSTIIEGMENFKDDYRIVRVDQLEETIEDICCDKRYAKEEIDQMVEVIENHKVGVVEPKS